MGINLEAVKKIKQDKIQSLLFDAWGKWAINPHIIGEVQIEENEDFNFIYFESIADNSATGMKRYHFAVYSFLASAKKAFKGLTNKAK